MKAVSQILHQNNLARTSCREEIIKVIVESPTPLAEGEIKKAISGNYDRSTFYRTFKILISKEIIHKIVIDNTIIKYALSEKQNQNMQHVHFYCISYNRVFCIPEVNLEYYSLPNGYKAEQTENLFKEYCSNCN